MLEGEMTKSEHEVAYLLPNEAISNNFGMKSLDVDLLALDDLVQLAHILFSGLS
jgi:hypothetical protein